MIDKIKSFFKKYYVALIIIFGAIIVDYGTKILITNVLNYTLSGKKVVSVDEIEVIKEFFYISYARNTGAGWSLLSDKTSLLIGITVIALGIFVFMMKEFDIKKRFFFSFGLSLMIGGTIGNFGERIYHGFVTDFLDFIIFGYDYPVFNVADICLVVGTISVLVSLFFTKENAFESKKSPLDNNHHPDDNHSDDSHLEDESIDESNVETTDNNEKKNEAN